jgi:RHS repeat-associated protein
MIHKFYKTLFFVILLAFFATVSRAGNPDCRYNPKCTVGCPSYNKCACENSGTGAGSIRFGIDIFGVSSRDSYRASVLNFDQVEPSVTMFTPQGLKYFSPASSVLDSVTGDFTANESVQVVVTSRSGTGIAFKVADGESMGYAIDSVFRDSYELEMLDANMQPIIDAVPTYVRRNDLSDDSSVIFDVVTGDAIQEIDVYGAITEFSEIDVVRSSGVLRQIVTPEGLIDFFVIDPDFEFEIRFYRITDVDLQAPRVDGVYSLVANAVPWKTYNIQNPSYDIDDIDETYITQVWEGRTTLWKFKYFTTSNLWEMQLGEINGEAFNLLRSESTKTVTSASGAVRTYEKKVTTAGGELLSSSLEIREDFSGLTNVLTQHVEDPTAANLVTNYGYYTSGNGEGEKKFEQQPDGTWTAYKYDSEGRTTLTVESWLDSAYDDSVTVATLAASAQATYSSYTPVDSRDDGSLQPDAPRSEIVKIEGVVSGMTWHAYFRDASGLYHQITERSTSQSASYGDAANLRSETVYYSTVADGESTLRAGRLKSQQDEDGHLTSYDYAEGGNGDFTVSQTQAHLDAPGGLAYKSTRSVATYDQLANLTREEIFVFDGSTDQSVYYLTYVYDADRNKTETRRFDGILAGRVINSAIYNHGKATVVTDESGRTSTTIFDILDRKELETVAGSAAAGVGAITRLYQYSTAATGCGCSASEVLIMNQDGSLSMTEVNETDRVKRPTRTVNVNGLETTYEYTEAGRTITVSNPDTSTRITTSYLDGRVKSITGTGSIPEYYSYGVNPDGTTWTRVDTGSANSPRTRTITLDIAGRLLRELSPAYEGTSLTSEYVYDAFGRLVSQSQPGRADTLYVYDSAGELVRSGLDLDGNGQLELSSTDRITDFDRNYVFESGACFDQSITSVYPTLGSATAVDVSTTKRRLSGFSGNLANESITIDIQGNATISSTAIDRNSQTVTQTTDVPGSIIDAVSTSINGYLITQNSTTVSAATSYDYDDLGRRISVKDPRHDQAVTIDYYTGTNQIFTQTDAADNTTAFTYHENGVAGAGQVASVTDALLQKSYQAYDLLGRQIQAWGETDYPQAYSYNAYGELSTLTTWRDTAIDFSTSTWPAPAGGDVTTWSYDPATGLLTRKQYADGNGTDYSYDAANRLAVRTWARSSGLDTTYSYSATTGELITVDYEDPNTADIAYTYDRLGRQATVTDATGSRSFDYDSSSLKLSSESLDATFYDGQQLTRSYDTFGRSSGYNLTDSASSTLSAVNYTYDSSGRLATVTDPANGGSTFTYGYTPNSNLLASLTAPQHTVAYTYEPNRNVMTTLDNQLAGGTSSVSSYTYTYDALGRRGDRTQSGSAITTSTDDFGYNSRSEVIRSTNSLQTAAAWNPTFDYDQIGNRQSSTGFQPVSAYTVNELNQYTAIDSTNPIHDLDGNLTSDGNWTYTWNNENRLSTATNGTITIDFTYDYQGRLIQKDDGTDVEIYAYEGWNRIATFEPSNLPTFTLAQRYIWGLDLSGSMQGAGGVGGLLKEGDLYPLFDANGNIMQKLDGTGTTVMHVDYDPFGNIISGTLVGEYGFSTKPLIDDLDWYYYGFRYYDPQTGRWPNRDPIEEWGGINLYGFVLNNPIRYTDVSGLSAWDVSVDVINDVVNELFSMNNCDYPGQAQTDTAMLNCSAICRHSETNAREDIDDGEIEIELKRVCNSQNNWGPTTRRELTSCSASTNCSQFGSCFEFTGAYEVSGIANPF